MPDLPTASSSRWRRHRIIIKEASSSLTGGGHRWHRCAAPQVGFGLLWRGLRCIAVAGGSVSCCRVCMCSKYHHISQFCHLSTINSTQQCRSQDVLEISSHAMQYLTTFISSIVIIMLHVLHRQAGPSSTADARSVRAKWRTAAASSTFRPLTSHVTFVKPSAASKSVPRWNAASPQLEGTPAMVVAITRPARPVSTLSAMAMVTGEYICIGTPSVHVFRVLSACVYHPLNKLQ